MSDDTKLQGIGGWLLLLIVTFGVLGPLLNVISLAGQIFNLEHQNPALLSDAIWERFKFFEWLAVAAFSVIQIRTAYTLSNHRTPKSVADASTSLWVVCIGAPLIVAVAVPAACGYMGMDGIFTAGILIAFECIYAVIWTSYLKQSRRVANTYGIAYGIAEAESASAASEGSVQRPSPLPSAAARISPIRVDSPLNSVVNQAVQRGDIQTLELREARLSQLRKCRLLIRAAGIGLPVVVAAVVGFWSALNESKAPVMASLLLGLLAGVVSFVITEIAMWLIPTQRQLHREEAAIKAEREKIDGTMKSPLWRGTTDLLKIAIGLAILSVWIYTGYRGLAKYF